MRHDMLCNSGQPLQEVHAVLSTLHASCVMCHKGYSAAQGSICTSAQMAHVATNGPRYKGKVLSKRAYLHKHNHKHQSACTLCWSRNKPA